MILSKQEYDDIINDTTKVIAENIMWEGNPNSPAREFRSDIDSIEGYPIFIKGWYNPRAGKLSYAIIYRGVGRIYGLDLGAEHQNPDREFVGDKHKNYWVPGSRGKWAYAPGGITETWDRPVEAWHQFCTEANLRHSGTIQAPEIQGAMLL